MIKFLTSRFLRMCLKSHILISQGLLTLDPDIYLTRHLRNNKVLSLIRSYDATLILSKTCLDGVKKVQGHSTKQSMMLKNL